MHDNGVNTNEVFEEFMKITEAENGKDNFELQRFGKRIALT